MDEEDALGTVAVGRIVWGAFKHFFDNFGHFPTFANTQLTRTPSSPKMCCLVYGIEYLIIKAVGGLPQLQGIGFSFTDGLFDEKKQKLLSLVS